MHFIKYQDYYIRADLVTEIKLCTDRPGLIEIIYGDKCLGCKYDSKRAAVEMENIIIFLQYLSTYTDPSILDITPD